MKVIAVYSIELFFLYKQDSPIAQIFELSASESNFSSLECLNDVERQYLRQYLAASEMTLEEMWAKSMRMLDNGDYICCMFHSILKKVEKGMVSMPQRI
jgi:hypothetical protein